MPSTKLVLIEGLPGSGKSATTHRLVRQLRRGGVVARWFAEQEAGHPTNVDNADDLERFAEETKRRWQRLVRAAPASGDVLLFEGSLFQSALRVLFHRDAAPHRIVAYARELEDVVAPMAPVLVHFRRPDIARSLRRTCDRRGQRWERRWVATITGKPYARCRGLVGFEGLVRYWQDYEALVDRILAGSRMKTLRIDTTGEAWGDYMATIAAALAVAPSPEPPTPSAALARLPGVYRDEASGHAVTVRAADGALLIDDFIFGTSRLLPVAGLTFEVEGWPLDLTFETDADGNIRQARIGGRDVEFVPLVGHSLRRRDTGPAGETSEHQHRPEAP